MAGAIEAGSTDCTEVVEEVESSEGHSVVQACTGLDRSSTAVVGGAVRNYVRMGIVAEQRVVNMRLADNGSDTAVAVWDHMAEELEVGE